MLRSADLTDKISRVDNSLESGLEILTLDAVCRDLLVAENSHI